jgi:putative acetyltransferase
MIQQPQINAEDPRDPEFAALFAEADLYYADLYPADSNHLVSGEELAAAGADFLSCRLEGRVLGCGAVVDYGPWGEIKRVYVAPVARGQGAGRLLMGQLIARAKARGLKSLRLEVGIRQPEAIGLYRQLGFTDIDPFADYQPDPLSLFMELELRGN